MTTDYEPLDEIDEQKAQQMSQKLQHWLAKHQDCNFLQEKVLSAGGLFYCPEVLGEDTGWATVYLLKEGRLVQLQLQTTRFAAYQAITEQVWDQCWEEAGEVPAVACQILQQKIASLDPLTTAEIGQSINLLSALADAEAVSSVPISASAQINVPALTNQSVEEFLLDYVYGAKELDTQPVLYTWREVNDVDLSNLLRSLD